LADSWLHPVRGALDEQFMVVPSAYQLATLFRSYFICASLGQLRESHGFLGFV
jgi:hypothetical protein